MKKRWLVLASVAVLAVGAGAAWALANRGDDPSSPRDLASLVAQLNDPGSPGKEMGWDRCFETVPPLDAEGQLNPELQSFPARLPGPEFELTSVQFGRLCGLGPPAPLLETQWRHRESGTELLIDQGLTDVAPTRIGDRYASFHDGGYDFNIINLTLLAPGQSQPNIEAQQRAIELALEQLQPPVPLKCFYRRTPRGWDDLAALGIGDPRPALVAGYTPMPLEFTVLQEPAADCPPVKTQPAEEPPVQFQGMFSGPANSLFAIHVHTLMPGDQTADAVFQPGQARWHSDYYAFHLDWAPEHVSDDQARAVAAALDPLFAGRCSLTARPVDFAGPDGARIDAPVDRGSTSVSATYLRIGPSAGCPANGAQSGFFAHWLFEYRDRGAIIEVTALQGAQLPGMRPFYDETRSIYWKRSDGVEFWVIGFKANFSREDLVAIAQSLDPEFDVSRLTAPAR